MKFAHLPVGQRFQYRGEWLVKIDPLTAAPEGSDGGRRLILRSAAVTIEAASASAASADSRPRAVDDAFTAFSESIRTVLDEALAGLEADSAGKLKADIATAVDTLRVAVERALKTP